jgi:hypothetical protein
MIINDKEVKVNKLGALLVLPSLIVSDKTNDHA